MKSHKILFGAAAVFVSAGAMITAAAPAEASDVTVVAQPDGDALRQAVSFADLDLTDKGGQKLLKSRVSRAVRTVCEPMDVGGLSSRYAECLGVAWSGVRPQMAAAIDREQRLATGQIDASTTAAAAITVTGVSQ